MGLWKEKTIKDIDINGYKLVEYWETKEFKNANLNPENIDDLNSFEKKIMDGQRIETVNYNIYYIKFEDPKIIVTIVEDKNSWEFYNGDDAWTEEVIEAIKKDVEN